MEKVIAIDGPSGSGKSSMAKRLAAELGLLFVDTGSMFRTLGLIAHERSLNLSDEFGLEQFLKSLDLQYGVSEEVLIQESGQDYTQKIREHAVSALASEISQIPTVRSFLLDFQRELPKGRVCVMEGRDIGSVVFPGAFCKFFMTASIEMRAQRRLEELRKKGGEKISLDALIEDIKKRDKKDQQRDIAPLIKSQDAFEIDNSELSPEEVIHLMKAKVEEKAKGHNINL